MTEESWHLLAILTSIAIVIEGLVLFGALKEIGSLVLQIGPARHGDVGGGPEIASVIDESTWPRGAPGILLFLSPSCTLCKRVVDALPSLRRAYPSLTLVSIVTGGSDATERHSYAEGLSGTVRVDNEGLFESWTIPGTPFGVGIQSDGRVVARGIVNNLPHLESIVDLILNQSEDSQSMQQDRRHELEVVPAQRQSGGKRDQDGRHE